MGRFIGRAKHYANPKSSAHQRANNAGGKTVDTNESVLAAAHAALFEGGVVRLAIVETTVSAGVDFGGTITPGAGTATVYALGFADDGLTPQVEKLTGQEVSNPFIVAYGIGALTAVVATGRLYSIVTPPIPTLTLATLIPVAPPVAGSRANPELALKSLLTTLNTMGIINNLTTV